MAKRAFDVACSSALLAVCAPVLGAAALAICVSDGRPIIFSQERPGRDGKPFLLHKFRTMRNSREKEGFPQFDAERLTRVGKMLRDLSVDELPQLWNVLRGDMSLVGPRPLLMRYLPRYTPEQARRHEVLPGITGWAQVNGRNAVTWAKKFELDTWYVDNWSLSLDMKILLRTAISVLHRSGISNGDHPTMPEFMGSSAAAPMGEETR